MIKANTVIAKDKSPITVIYLVITLIPFLSAHTQMTINVAKAQSAESLSLWNWRRKPECPEDLRMSESQRNHI